MSAVRERGSATIWVLGLCVAVLFVGGIALDLWRAVAVRRDLAAAADAAATAGANGLDEAALRAGDVRLDPGRARALALEALALDDRAASAGSVRVDADVDRVVVTLGDEVPFTLLRIFLAGEPFGVEVVAEARPRVE